MSSYRDDTVEMATIGDATWGGLHSIVEESTTLISALLFTVLVVHSSDMWLSDALSERSLIVQGDSAQLVDAVRDAVQRRENVVERAAALDRAFEIVLAALADDLGLSEVWSDSVLALAEDRAILLDQIQPQRRAKTQINDSAHVLDGAPQAASALIEEAVPAASQVSEQVRARIRLLDTAAFVDQVLDARRAKVAAAAESAIVEARVTDRLHARDMIENSGQLADDQQLDAPGQVWTANSDTWAVSRYWPFACSELAVIDGVLYGANEDGVYAIDGDDEPMEAAITTGMVDLGEGTLVHPLHAYLAYELDGAASLDITQTQSGTEQTYSYSLPPEPANTLTTGRFIFGRGLRGRFFRFALRLQARRGKVNDLSVRVAPTKRSV